MLHNPNFKLPQQDRTRCRNPRCTDRLKLPASNPRDAFCRPTCEAAFYRSRCRVCEQLFTRKTARRIVCFREKCRSQFKRHPEDFFGPRYPYGPVAHNAEKPSTKSKLKTAEKSGRGWRIIAGPTDLHPSNLRAHSADVAAMRTGRPGPVMFTRNTPPLNVIGGFKFQDAPVIDLFGGNPSEESDGQ